MGSILQAGRTGHNRALHPFARERGEGAPPVTDEFRHERQQHQRNSAFLPLEAAASRPIAEPRFAHEPSPDDRLHPLARVGIIVGLSLACWAAILTPLWWFFLHSN